METLYSRGLISARGGNISCRLDDGTMLITPTGSFKRELSPSDIVKMRLTGEVLSGCRPSIEWRMHAGIYLRSGGAGAVIHSHPPFTTGLSISLTVRPVTEECRLIAGEIATGPRMEQGSERLARAVSERARTHRAIVLRGHGLVAVGRNLGEAEAITEAVEENSKVFLIARLARPQS
jgi:L-fuculose-phosphate aldolase